MLKIEEAKVKTYEENLTEAIAEIPLYSDEWTNYNISDPGITILENLSALNAIQAQGIANIPYEAKLKLFALAGFKPMKGKTARVLLKAEGLKEKTTVPSGARFSLGGMIFETNRPAVIGGKMLGIFSKYGDNLRDITFLDDQEVPVGAYVFGERPKKNDMLYFVTDSLPEEGKELIIFTTLLGNTGRNPLEDKTANAFATLRFECYTEEGFVEIKARDYTDCFLVSGELRLRIPDKAAVYDELPVKGYCIRAVLDYAAYDIPPKLLAIESFLFEVWQRDTKATSIILSNTSRIQIRHPLAAHEHVLVFGKEEKGASYKRYELTYYDGESGRKVKYIPGDLDSNGFQKSFTLDFSTSEMIPDGKLKDPVRVVLYDDEIMKSYEIGKVLGYDGQELKLPIGSIVADSFSLIARRKDEDGDYIYDFVRPEKKEEGSLYYHLLENDGKILIEEAGVYIGADLFVGSIAIFEGEKGNVRARTRFTPVTDLPKANYYAPGPGTGGTKRETLNELVMRFRKDIDHTPYTAVTASDYEKLALSTPGLCLLKAHAVIDESENLVKIAVLPGTGGERPELSEIYKNEIAKRLDERRLLTTRIKVVSPAYVDIHVRGTVYVKRHYANPGDDIRKLLERLLDDIHSDRSFGQPLRFKQVFAAIEALDCVSFVYELSIMPDDRLLADYRDSDIFPKANVLCRAGDISIETVAGD